MKKIFVLCFSLLLFFISCDNKTTKKIENSATANLIKIGFHPATDGQPAETILNLKEKYLVFYSPEAYYHEIPPPSEISSVKTYNELISENPKLIPFRAEMTDKEIQEIRAIISSFSDQDIEKEKPNSNKELSEENEFIPQIDGLTVNIMIDYSDGKIIQINPVVKPRIKEFYQKIIHLLLIKNKEKNNQKILFKIEKYI
jgi:lipoprotein